METNNRSWLKSISLNDKMDVFDGFKWYVATAIEIEKAQNMAICVRYDGYPSRFDERIHIKELESDKNEDVTYYLSWRPWNLSYPTDYKCNVIQHQKVRPLHTMTPFHDYILYKNGIFYGESKLVSPCSVGRRPNETMVQCTICNRNCCIKCFIVKIFTKTKGKHEYGYHCKDCVILLRYKCLFGIIKLFYDSLFHHNLIDINIIRMITNYSCNYLVNCKCNQCQRKIIFASQSEKRMVDHIGPLSGNINLNDIYMKIFCGLVIKICNNVDCKYTKCIRFDECMPCDGCSKLFCKQCVQSIGYDKEQDALLCDYCYMSNCNCYQCKHIICNCDKSVIGLKVIYTKNELKYDMIRICGTWYRCNHCHNKICHECCKYYQCHGWNCDNIINSCDTYTCIEYFNCDGCSKMFCNECIQSTGYNDDDDALLCDECYIIYCKCNNCARIICKCDKCVTGLKVIYTTQTLKYDINTVCGTWYRCNECNSKICHGCHQYYQWNKVEWNKIEKCNNCNSDCDDFEVMDEMIYKNVSKKKSYNFRKKIFRKNTKRNLSKKRQKIRSYIKRKNDKKSNVKQNKKFKKRYILSLQQ